MNTSLGFEITSQQPSVTDGQTNRHTEPCIFILQILIHVKLSLRIVYIQTQLFLVSCRFKMKFVLVTYMRIHQRLI